MFESITDLVSDKWEIEDLYKAIAATIAGVILGIERELKDKAAGLKTITLITLGSTLFTLLSYKMGAGTSEDGTRIASYVVSGIGFLGAGVIFKDGMSINGLTTASIIWFSAAVGMSIAFEQYATTLIFFMLCMIVTNGGNYLSKWFFSKNVPKLLVMRVPYTHENIKLDIVNDIRKYSVYCEVKSTEKIDLDLILTLDIVVDYRIIPNLDDYLMRNTEIKSFKY